MKSLFLTLICIVFHCNCTFGQNNITGVWLVCESPENCEEDPIPVYMFISEDTISVVMSYATGTDPKISGLSSYTYENEMLETFNTNHNGEVISNKFILTWKNPNEVELSNQNDEGSMYLFRQEEE